MKIKLQEALDLVQSADVVKLLSVDSYILPEISIDSIVNDPLNEVLRLSWYEDGLEFSIKVAENTDVRRQGHKMTFTDTEGEPFEIHLFRLVPILP